MKKETTKKIKKSDPIKYPVCPFCKETMHPGVAYYRDGVENDIYAWQCNCECWPKKIKKKWGIE